MLAALYGYFVMLSKKTKKICLFFRKCALTLDLFYLILYNIVRTILPYYAQLKAKYGIDKYTDKDLMLLFFGNKIVKVEILDRNGTVAVTSEKNFVFPKNIETSEDSILIIKGADLKEFAKDERVHVISTTKAGDRIKYPGMVTVSLDTQLNVRIIKSHDTEVLQERRRYFKIKVFERGRVLFMVRDDETTRFEEPVPMEINDINIGGVFMVTSVPLQEDDIVCIDVDLFIDYRLNAVARVLRVQRNPDGTVKGYGCAFQGLTASQEDYIGKYIYKVQSAQRQKEIAKERPF